MTPTTARPTITPSTRPAVRRWLAPALVCGALGLLAGCADPVAVRDAGPRRLYVCDPDNPDCNDRNPPPAPVTHTYGINVNVLASGDPTFDAGLGSMASYLAQARIGWVRLDVNWLDYQDSGAQCVNGSPPAPNRDWSDHGQYYYLDRTMQRAATAGLSVLPVLAYPPLTESSAGCNAPADVFYHYAPRDLDGWKAFVSAMVARYPQVTVWEVWNETNSGFFRVMPSSGQGKAAAYADLVNAAAPIIHAAGAKVLGVDAINTGGDGGELVETQTFVRDVMARAGNNVDIASLHFYPDPGSGVVSAINTTVNTIRSVASSSPALSNIWVTEAGIDQDSPGLTTEANDVTQLLTAMVGGQAPAWKGTFYWHAFLDATHGTTDNRGILSGVFTNSVQTRPAYTAYQNFTANHP